MAQLYSQARGGGHVRSCGKKHKAHRALCWMCNDRPQDASVSQSQSILSGQPSFHGIGPTLVGGDLAPSLILPKGPGVRTGPVQRNGCSHHSCARRTNLRSYERLEYLIRMFGTGDRASPCDSNHAHPWPRFPSSDNSRHPTLFCSHKVRLSREQRCVKGPQTKTGTHCPFSSAVTQRPQARAAQAMYQTYGVGRQRRGTAGPRRWRRYLARLGHLVVRGPRRADTAGHSEQSAKIPAHELWATGHGTEGKHTQGHLLRHFTQGTALGPILRAFASPSVSQGETLCHPSGLRPRGRMPHGAESYHTTMCKRGMPAMLCGTHHSRPRTHNWFLHKADHRQVALIPHQARDALCPDQSGTQEIYPREGHATFIGNAPQDPAQNTSTPRHQRWNTHHQSRAHAPGQTRGTVAYTGQYDTAPPPLPGALSARVCCRAVYTRLRHTGAGLVTHAGMPTISMDTNGSR